MSRASLATWLGSAALLAAAGGVAVAVAGDREVLYGVGMGLIGVAVVLLLSLAFYAVGRSEDREREREARRDSPRASRLLDGGRASERPPGRTRRTRGHG
jgi:hypothetical protein